MGLGSESITYGNSGRREPARSARSFELQEQLPTVQHTHQLERLVRVRVVWLQPAS